MPAEHPARSRAEAKDYAGNDGGNTTLPLGSDSSICILASVTLVVFEDFNVLLLYTALLKTS